MRPTALVILALVSAGVWAADLGRPSENDARVRYVTYKPDDVVLVRVRRGVVTRLILDPNETIKQAGTGFEARCKADDKSDELEWCIRAEPGSNQVWIKPREHATHNNLELQTTRRDYSIRLEVLPDTPAKGTDEMYRVIFQYPAPELPLPAALLTGDTPPAAPADDQALLKQRMAAHPVPRNTRYSMEAIGGGDAIAPSLVFDDGRFTYFRFPNNREVPAPFVIAADKKEARVNFHVDGDLMVVHKVAPQWMLRLGNAVVGIWNDAYDPDGVGTPSGVVKPNVQRDVKAHQ